VIMLWYTNKPVNSPTKRITNPIYHLDMNSNYKRSGENIKTPQGDLVFVPLRISNFVQRLKDDSNMFGYCGCAKPSVVCGCCGSTACNECNKSCSNCPRRVCFNCAVVLIEDDMCRYCFTQKYEAGTLFKEFNVDQMFAFSRMRKFAMSNASLTSSSNDSSTTSSTYSINNT
jgi:hypothetical protein